MSGYDLNINTLAKIVNQYGQKNLSFKDHHKAYAFRYR
jgi:hypothetical protein